MVGCEIEIFPPPQTTLTSLSNPSALAAMTNNFDVLKSGAPLTPQHPMVAMIMSQLRETASLFFPIV